MQHRLGAATDQRTPSNKCRWQPVSQPTEQTEADRSKNEPDGTPKHKSSPSHDQSTRQGMRGRHHKPANPVTIPGNIWTSETLWPWQKYSKLLGERKFARKFVSVLLRTLPTCILTISQPKKPFLLMTLPAELRLQIYEYALVSRRAIDLWPLNEYWLQSVKFGRDYIDVNYMRDSDQVYQLHHARLRREIAPNLMRVSKLVHQETSAIFYGKNQFRFTQCNGWFILTRFLMTIGVSNRNNVRHLTVDLPGPCGFEWSDAASARYKTVLQMIHLSTQKSSRPQQESLRLFGYLETGMSNLKVLELVIHAQSSPERHVSDRYSELMSEWANAKLASKTHDWQIPGTLGQIVNLKLQRPNLRFGIAVLEVGEGEQWDSSRFDETFQRKAIEFFRSHGFLFHSFVRRDSRYKIDRSYALTEAEIAIELGVVDGLPRSWQTGFGFLHV